VLRIVLPEKAEAILGFRAAPELQARIEELAGKSTEGELTETERTEYAGYVRANKFIAILQRQARQLIGIRTPKNSSRCGPRKAARRVVVRLAHGVWWKMECADFTTDG
jgi:hypothetical protein